MRGAADLLGWTDGALDQLEQTRGWTEQAIERLELTWNETSGRVGIPVRDQTATDLGELRYDPTGKRTPKMLAGAGTPRELFPPPELIDDQEPAGTLWLVEGEPDAIRAWSLGLAAVAVPGAAAWRDEWAARLSGRGWRIAVCFDCDQAGRAAAARAAGALAAHGLEARVVDLDPDRDDGYDLTDWTRRADTAELRTQAAAALTAIADVTPAYWPPAPDLGPDDLERETPERLLLALADLRERHEREDETDWIWDQLVAPGYLTRVDGRPKVAGKSTLLFALAAAIRNGQDFLGFHTRPVTVAYCSEQRWQALHQKLLLPFGAPPYMHLYHDEPLDLAQLIPRLLEETEQLGVELVVIDTVSKWLRLPAGGRSDSDVMGAQMGLLEELSQRVAVIVADYTRKGDSARGEATLGATEQTGRADILIELKRPDPDHPTLRRMEITGRSDAPEEIDYIMSSDGILERANLDELQAGADAAEILRVMREAEDEGGPALSGSQIAATVGRRKATILQTLEQLVEAGRIYTLGRGRSQIWALKSVPQSVPNEPEREPE